MKLKKKLDPNYVKICAYAVVSALIAFALGLLIYHSDDVFKRLWTLFIAVFKPLVFGAMLCYLVLPVVKKLECWLQKTPAFRTREKTAHTVAAILTLLLVAAVIVLVLGLLLWLVFRNIRAINFEQLKTLVTSLTGDFSRFVETLQAQLGKIGVPHADLGGKLTSILDGVKSFLSTALFSIIFSFYFLLDGNNIASYWARAFRILTRGEPTGRSAQILADADKAFSGYIRGQVLDALIVGALIIAVFLTVGIPYAAVIGALSGIGNLIPYVGPVVGYLTLAFVCLTEGNLKKLLLGAVLLTLIMIVDNNVIEPRLVGNSVEVHPLLVLAALIGGGAVGGLAGMLLAVPIAAFLKLQFDRYLQEKEAKAEESEKS